MTQKFFLTQKSFLTHKSFLTPPIFLTQIIFQPNKFLQPKKIFQAKIFILNQKIQFSIGLVLVPLSLAELSPSLFKHVLSVSRFSTSKEWDCALTRQGLRDE